MMRKTRKAKAKSTVNSPTIDTVNVINLDDDIKRWDSLYPSLKKIKPTPVRWSATHGKDLLRTEMHKLGIGFAMVHSGKGPYEKQHKDLRNLGTVGCFLSHKSLLTSLSK